MLLPVANSSVVQRRGSVVRVYRTCNQNGKISRIPLEKLERGKWLLRAEQTYQDFHVENLSTAGVRGNNSGYSVAQPRVDQGKASLPDKLSDLAVTYSTPPPELGSGSIIINKKQSRFALRGGLSLPLHESLELAFFFGKFDDYLVINRESC